VLPVVEGQLNCRPMDTGEFRYRITRAFYRSVERKTNYISLRPQRVDRKSHVGRLAVLPSVPVQRGAAVAERNRQRGLGARRPTSHPTPPAAALSWVALGRWTDNRQQGMPHGFVSAPGSALTTAHCQRY